MMKNAKLKFSEYMQNISRSKSIGKFVLIVLAVDFGLLSNTAINQLKLLLKSKIWYAIHILCTL